MTNQELIEQAKKLIAIPSSEDNPNALRAAYDFMVEFVRKNNPKVTIEKFESNGIHSFLAYKGAKRPEKFHLLLNGHVDVIAGKPEQYEPTIKDGKLYGRGSHDMKAACVILAQLFCDYVDKVPFELGLEIVTDEEPGGHNGVQHHIKQGLRADFVICGEAGRSTNKHEIANECKGVVFADVEFTGKSAHGAYPWRGENAAIQASHFAKKLHDIHPTPEEEWHDTTVTVTGISSTSGVHNKVPDHALVKIDIRFTAEDARFKTKDDVIKFISDIDPNAKLTKFHVFLSPMYADPNGEFMRSLKQAAENVEGQPFNFVRRHGGSDGMQFTAIGGQACEFGIAGENHHGDNEYITLEAFDNYVATMRQFLDSFEKQP